MNSNEPEYDEETLNKEIVECDVEELLDEHEEEEDLAKEGSDN